MPLGYQVPEVVAFYSFITRVRNDLWMKIKPPSGTWKSIRAFINTSPLTYC